MYCAHKKKKKHALKRMQATLRQQSNSCTRGPMHATVFSQVSPVPPARFLAMSLTPRVLIDSSGEKERGRP